MDSSSLVTACMSPPRKLLPLSQRGNQNATIHYSLLAEPKLVLKRYPSPGL